MSVEAPAPFLEEAGRIGRDVAHGALRSRGRATWLADRFAFVEGRWRPTVGTLGPDLATGTAGVGWFLARLAAATGDRRLSDLAVAALRHGLDDAAALARAGRLDWYEGTTGIAWAAIDAGRALGDAELVASGVRTAGEAVDAVRDRAGDPARLALVGGEAGVLAGLLALAATGYVDDAVEAAGGPATRLVEALLRAASPAPAGLARGLSGTGLALAAAAVALDRGDCREAAEHAFAEERARYEPGAGWVAPPAHAWRAPPTAADAGWCRGAAGIGLARLGAHAAHGDLMLLAEAGAAVELVRRRLATANDPDASLCHGAAGMIELFLSAGALLGEEAHTLAARSAGGVLVRRARSRGGYGSGVGARARNPALLLGLAGTATLLLRLHDHRALPSPALPPLGQDGAA